MQVHFLQVKLAWSHFQHAELAVIYLMWPIPHTKQSTGFPEYGYVFLRTQGGFPVAGAGSGAARGTRDARHLSERTRCVRRQKFLTIGGLAQCGAAPNYGQDVCSLIEGQLSAI